MPHAGVNPAARPRRRAVLALLAGAPAAAALPAAARRGELLVLSFHPGLGDDPRRHAAFLGRVRALRGGAPRA